MPAGRPSSYNAEIADQFCLRIATSNRSVKRICEDDDDMPGESTIYTWLFRHPEFRENYALAKQAQAAVLYEEMGDIADDGRNDWMERLAYNGGLPSWEARGEHIQRSRLRWDDRRWKLSKLLPKKYGDRVETRIADADGEKLQAIRVEFVVPTHTELPDRTIELERGSEEE